MADTCQFVEPVVLRDDLIAATYDGAFCIPTVVGKALLRLHYLTECVHESAGVRVPFSDRAAHERFERRVEYRVRKLVQQLHDAGIVELHRPSRMGNQGRRPAYWRFREAL